MKAMVILRRCRRAEEELARLDMSIRQKRDVLGYISGPRMDPNGGGRGTPDPDKNGRLLGDIDQLERKRDQRAKRRDAEMAAATKLLDMVPETESRILFGYYVKRLSIVAIARKESFQPSYVKRKKKGAEELMDMLEESRVNKTLPKWYMQEEKGEDAE